MVLVSTPVCLLCLTKPILFLCHHKGFCTVIDLDDILVLVHSKQAGKWAHSFCVPYWFALDYILIFPILTVVSLRLFVSWGYDGIQSIMSVSLPRDKLTDIQ